MSEHEEREEENGSLRALLSVLSGEAISVPKGLIGSVGDVSAALALSVLFGWSSNAEIEKVDRGGEIWLVPTVAQWQDSACLGGNELSRALSHLRTLGLVEVKTFVWRPKDMQKGEGGEVSTGDESGSRQHIKIVWEACVILLTTDVSLDDAVSKPTRQSGKKKAGPVTLASLGFTPHDDDRERLEQSLSLAVTLAKLVTANTQKEPAVTKTWVMEIERMIRLEGYTDKQIENAILWSQSNDFWWKNIRSPQKLRRHFELLREQARRNPQQAKELIEKSKLILQGKQKATGDKKDVFDENSEGSGFGGDSEEELAKSWGMVWSEEQQRWVQPRPDL